MTESESHRQLYDKLWSGAGWRGAVRLGPANRMRHQIMATHLESTLSKISREGALHTPLLLCDYGCGDGSLLETFKDELARKKNENLKLRFFGCDISADALGKASWIEFAQGDLSSDTFDLSRKFDVGICSEVLEHVPSSEKALKNIAKSLKPGGILIVSVPSGPIFSYDKKVGHLRHFTAQMLRSEMEASGFKKIKITRHGFPVHTIYKFGAHFLPSSRQDQMMALREPSRPARLALEFLYQLMMVSRIPLGGLQLFAEGVRE